MSAEYILGSSPEETARLQLQGRLYGPATEDLLRRAGIGPGMRVLEVGAGVGDVTLHLARLVGPDGSVLAVDRDPTSLDTLLRRAGDAGFDHVGARCASIEELAADPSLHEGFDVVVGRLILVHLAAPSDAVRGLARHVRPGGIVTFQEIVPTGMRSAPLVPEWERARDLCIEALQLAGLGVDTGDELPRLLRAAGLTGIDVGAIQPCAAEPDSPVLDWGVATLASFAPVSRRTGRSDAEIGLANLPERLRRAMAEHDAIYYMPPLVGAWARAAS